MAQSEDPLAEGLRRKKQEQDEDQARRQQERDAERQAVADHRAAFRELVEIPRARLAEAADKASMKLKVMERHDAVAFSLGEHDPVQFTMKDLEERGAGVPPGDVVGAAYFGQVAGAAKAVLNSCNFVRIQGGDNKPTFWRGCRFRVSGGVPGEAVAARLHLGAVPTFDDLFGVQYAAQLYEHTAKAGRGMHVVTVDYTDDLKGLIDQILAKSLA